MDRSRSGDMLVACQHCSNQHETKLPGRLGQSSAHHVDCPGCSSADDPAKLLETLPCEKKIWHTLIVDKLTRASCMQDYTSDTCSTSSESWPCWFNLEGATATQKASHQRWTITPCHSQTNSVARKRRHWPQHTASLKTEKLCAR